MKTKTVLSILLFLSGILATNVLYAQEKIELTEDFEAITISVGADVVVKRSADCVLHVKASDSEMEMLEFYVKNGVLNIKRKTDCYQSHGYRNLQIAIGMPTIKSAKITGSADMRFTDKFETESVDLEITGSGSVIFDDLAANFVNAEITGSGDVELQSGAVADVLDIKITGSGDFISNEVAAKEVKVSISGSGDATLKALETLNVRVSGSGDIVCFGSPRITSSMSGSGTLQTK